MKSLNHYLSQYNDANSIKVGDVYEHPLHGNIRIISDDDDEKISAYFEKHGTKCDSVETVQMLLGIRHDEAIQKITEDMGISLKAKPKAIVFDRNPDGYNSSEEWESCS
jgi:hypothetical protein